MFSKREELVHKWLAIFALMMGVLGIAGCNTVEGFGKDLGKLGDKIEHSAEKRK